SWVAPRNRSFTTVIFLSLARRPDLAGRASRRRNVALLCVVHHHAVRVETPTQRADGPFHALDPSSRQSIAVTLIEERNQLVAQNAVEVLAVAGIVHVEFRVCSASANSKAVQPVVGFSP